MIYLVVTLDHIHFTPSIHAFTNKKDAEAFEIEQRELSLQLVEKIGFEMRVFTMKVPWKNTKREFVRLVNHYLQ